MRKRDIPILFRLNFDEATHFNQLVLKSGIPRERFIRSMIQGYQLHEKPDDSFYKAMRDLSAIGNRINQLAVKANALGFIDTPLLRQEVIKWQIFQLEIKEKYLLPIKDKIK